MKLRDIFYVLKCNGKQIICIDEVFDDGRLIHHSNGKYFLMDGNCSEEIRHMEDYARMEGTEIVQNMSEGDCKNICLNGYDISITVKDICGGGFFK